MVNYKQTKIETYPQQQQQKRQDADEDNKLYILAY